MLAATRDAFILLLSGDAQLWRIVWISFKTSLAALVLAAPLAVGLGYAIASSRFAGRRMVIWLVQAALSLPTVQAADPRYAETAMAHGASRWRTMLTVLHEVRFGVVAAVISGFGRVISEVGCALMIGGNIAGETRTITTAIALETSKGDFAQGIALGIVLIVLALLMNGALMFLQGDAHAVRGRA